MKNSINTIAISGFVGADAEIKTFSTASIARFSIALNRTDGSKKSSTWLPFEAWRKNDNTTEFDLIKKGALITVEGFLKPEEWTTSEGVKRTKVVYVATKIYPVEDKVEEVQKPKRSRKAKKE